MGCMALDREINLRKISHPLGERFPYDSRHAQRAEAFAY